MACRDQEMLQSEIQGDRTLTQKLSSKDHPERSKAKASLGILAVRGQEKKYLWPHPPASLSTPHTGQTQAESRRQGIEVSFLSTQEEHTGGEGWKTCLVKGGGENKWSRFRTTFTI